METYIVTILLNPHWLSKNEERVLLEASSSLSKYIYRALLWGVYLRKHKYMGYFPLHHVQSNEIFWKN